MHLISVLETDRWDPNQRVSLIIDTERGSLVDHPGLFGETVNQAFPSAVEDIRAAGNCLAAQCSTAAVFHLMRVAEVGLKALARDRRVRLPKNKTLGLNAWDTIFRELENAEETIRQYPKTQAQEAQYAFHHQAMTHAARFKDIFRHQVMHDRQHFGHERAMNVFQFVKGFMQTLASRITESTRTPLLWKGKRWAKPATKSS